MDILNTHNIPTNDVEAWEKYTKLNWMYSTARVLEAQSVAWCPFKTEKLSHYIRAYSNDTQTLSIKDNTNSLGKSGGANIFVAPTEGNHVRTEAVIQNGHVKWLAHIEDGEFVSDIIGEIDLRINAFATLYFKKFHGFVSFETIGNTVYGVKLHPTVELMDKYPEEATKLLKRVYRRI